MPKSSNLGSTLADFQAFLRQRHINEAGLVVGGVVHQSLLDACCGLLVLRYHIQVTATTGAWQFVAEAKVINLLRNGLNGSRIGAAIEGLVLYPCLANQLTCRSEIAALNGIVEVQRMS